MFDPPACSQPLTPLPPPRIPPAQYLPAITDPNRSKDSDMCRMPPNTCDPEGRLQQLTLANMGLNCGPMGLPTSVSTLKALRTLDLGYNDIGGSLSRIAEILSQVGGG